MLTETKNLTLKCITRLFVNEKCCSVDCGPDLFFVPVVGHFAAHCTWLAAAGNLPSKVKAKKTVIKSACESSLL